MTDMNALLDKFIADTSRDPNLLPDVRRPNGALYENIPDDEFNKLFYDPNNKARINGGHGLSRFNPDDGNSIENTKTLNDEYHKTMEDGIHRVWKLKEQFRGS